MRLYPAIHAGRSAVRATDRLSRRVSSTCSTRGPPPFEIAGNQKSENRLKSRPRAAFFCGRFDAGARLKIKTKSKNQKKSSFWTRRRDYGQIVKFYEAEPIGPGRYSPPHVTRTEKSVIAGEPDQAYISTSLVERQNLTMRMNMRRFTRLTNGFSKKVENLAAAVAVHFAYYNLVRVHKTLRVTPAMAAVVSDRLWSLEELVERTS